MHLKFLRLTLGRPRSPSLSLHDAQQIWPRHRPPNIAKMAAFSLWICLSLLPLLPSSNAVGIPSLPAKTGGQPDPSQMVAIAPTTAPEFNNEVFRRQTFKTQCGFISADASSLLSNSRPMPLADTARALQMMPLPASVAMSASQDAAMSVAVTPRLASRNAVFTLHASNTMPIQPGSAWTKVSRHDAGEPLRGRVLADSRDTDHAFCQ